MSESAGKVLLIPKGAYDGSATYSALNVVSYGHNSYVAKQATTGNLPTDTTYWQNLTNVTADASPTSGSINLVESGGVYSELALKANTADLGTAAAKNSTNAVTQNSTDLVESGAVYTANKGIYEVMGHNGAINLLPNDATSQTINGVTFTVNDDKSVTVNGTATAVVQFPIIKKILILKAGNYLLSTKNNIPTNVYFSIYITGQGWKDITNDANSIEFSGNSNIEISTCRLYIAKDVTLSDLTFYPMIADARYKGGYVPHAKTNQQLTSKTDGLWDNMMENGAVNLLPNYGTTQTISPVTFTVNADKTVTASASQATSSVCNFGITWASKNYKLKPGTYKLTGCPSGGKIPTGTDDTYAIECYNQTANSRIGWDAGDGLIFTLTAESVINIIISIRNGYNLNGSKVFKPMISDPALNLSYDDYVPYAMTNGELTEEVTALQDGAGLPKKTLVRTLANGKITATIPKNLGSSYAQGSLKLIGANADSEAHVTFCLNSDNTVVAIQNLTNLGSKELAIDSATISGNNLVIVISGAQAYAWFSAEYFMSMSAGSGAIQPTWTIAGA